MGLRIQWLQPALHMKALLFLIAFICVLVFSRWTALAFFGGFGGGRGVGIKTWSVRSRISFCPQTQTVFSLMSAFCVLLKPWEIWNEARFQLEWRHRHSSHRQRAFRIIRLTTISVRSSLTAVSGWGQRKHLIFKPDVASLTLSHCRRWTTFLRGPFMKSLGCSSVLVVNRRPFSWADSGVRSASN